MDNAQKMMDEISKKIEARQVGIELVDLLIPKDERTKLWELSVRWTIIDVGAYAISSMGSGANKKNREVVAKLLRELGDLIIKEAGFDKKALPCTINAFMSLVPCNDPGID